LDQAKVVGLACEDAVHDDIVFYEVERTLQIFDVNWLFFPDGVQKLRKTFKTKFGEKWENIYNHKRDKMNSFIPPEILMLLPGKDSNTCSLFNLHKRFVSVPVSSRTKRKELVRQLVQNQITWKDLTKQETEYICSELEEDLSHLVQRCQYQQPKKIISIDKEQKEIFPTPSTSMKKSMLTSRKPESMKLSSSRFIDPKKMTDEKYYQICLETGVPLTNDPQEIIKIQQSSQYPDIKNY